MGDPTQEVAVVTHADEIGMERLQRTPIIDRIDERQLALIKATLAISENEHQPITLAELGHFLELAAHYGLDPFAREVWIAKSKTGKLLIMVGRMGLRKIVNRNGLKMRSAAIYAKDEYAVEHIDNPADAKDGEWDAHGRAPFHRVTHRQSGIGEEGRGKVVGAWARVTDPKTNVEAGWFDAPLSEYMPANVSHYSPWSKQVSAMMRGAVERQAAQEATPLGGLLVEGEDESANARQTIGEGVGSGEGPGWGGMDADRIEQVEAIVAQARALNFAPFADEAVLQQRLNGQPRQTWDRFISTASEQLASMAMNVAAEPEPEDATVVHDPLTLTFGGETFTFADEDASLRDAIRSALDSGDNEALIELARKLDAQVESLRLGASMEGYDLTTDPGEQYHSMAVAMVREAVGQTGGEG